jgi:N-methylhydantoinase B
MGARPTKDGLSSTAFPSGVSGTPAEIVEARSPLLFVKRELRTDSGGPGRYRGGLGHWLALKGVRTTEPYRFSPFCDRTQYPARGLGGGLPGAPGEYRLERSETANASAALGAASGWPAAGERMTRTAEGEAQPASVEQPNPKATVWVEPETEIVLGLPGGGGFGDPLIRDPELVRADVLDGYVSIEHAREDYGVILESAPTGGDGALRVDPPATERLRAAKRERPPTSAE